MVKVIRLEQRQAFLDELERQLNYTGQTVTQSNAWFLIHLLACSTTSTHLVVCMEVSMLNVLISTTLGSCGMY